MIGRPMYDCLKICTSAISTWRLCGRYISEEAELNVTLNAAEIAELDKQNPTTAGDGGFQSLMV